MNKQTPDLIIERAVTVFTEINQKINSLIDCSAKDFDSLNQSFKEYHSTIEFIIDRATQLYKGVINLPDEKINQNLDQLNTLEDRYRKTYKLTFEIERITNNLLNEISYSFIHFNNIKQNISTLKLLTTNIQLEPFFRKQYLEIFDAIKDISHCCQGFIKEFIQYENQLKSCSEILEQIKNHHLSFIFQTTEQIQKGLAEFASRKMICSGYDQIMSDLLSKRSVSSSEIITNLQFQDIICQKIEHVRHAHESLLKKLNDFYSNRKLTTHNKSELILEIILQIRNIGSLQAAQLIRANSEYQKAIKNITSKFDDLDHVLDESMQLLNVFLTSGESFEEYLYSEFERKVILFTTNTETLQSLYINYNQEYLALFKSNESIFSFIENYDCTIEHMDSIVNNLKVSINNQKSEFENEDTITQIVLNFNELKNNSYLLSNLLNKLKHELHEKFMPVLSEFLTNLKQANLDSRNMITSIHELIPKELANLIKDKQHFIEKEVYAGRFNINNVEYYKMFEEEVESIITKLDNLIRKIDFNEVESKVSSESLENLKRLYTMKSERDVHAEFIGKKSDKEDSENEIELF